MKLKVHHLQDTPYNLRIVEPAAPSATAVPATGKTLYNPPCATAESTGRHRRRWEDNRNAPRCGTRIIHGSFLHEDDDDDEPPRGDAAGRAALATTVSAPIGETGAWPPTRTTARNTADPDNIADKRGRKRRNLRNARKAAGRWPQPPLWQATGDRGKRKGWRGPPPVHAGLAELALKVEVACFGPSPVFIPTTEKSPPPLEIPPAADRVPSTGKIGERGKKNREGEGQTRGGSILMNTGGSILMGVEGHSGADAGLLGRTRLKRPGRVFVDGVARCRQDGASQRDGATGSGQWLPNDPDRGSRRKTVIHPSRFPTASPSIRIGSPCRHGRQGPSLAWLPEGFIRCHQKSRSVTSSSGWTSNPELGAADSRGH